MRDISEKKKEKQQDSDNDKEPMCVMDRFSYAGLTFLRFTDVNQYGGIAATLDLHLKNEAKRYGCWVSLFLS